MKNDSKIKNGSKIVDELDGPKVLQLYKSQKDFYIDSIGFQRQIRAAEEIKKFFNNRPMTSKDLVSKLESDLFNERALDTKFQDIKFLEDKKLSQEQKKAKIKSQFKTISKSIAFIEGLISEVESLDKLMNNIIDGSDVKAARLINKLEQIQLEIKKGSKGQDLEAISRGLRGMKSDFDGDVVEFLTYEYIEQNSQKMLDAVFPNAKFKKMDLQATGKSQISGIGGYDKATMALSGLTSTDVRDLSIKMTGDGVTIYMGISVKNYNLSKNPKSVNVKMRTTNFNQILTRISGARRLQNPELSKEMGAPLLNQTKELIHSFKYLDSEESKNINNLIPNIKKRSVPYVKLFALIAYDTMISQGDFLKQGVQVLFLTNRALNIEDYLPTNPSRLSLANFNPKKLRSSGGDVPGYSVKLDPLTYLMRYSSLSLELHQRIAVR